MSFRPNLNVWTLGKGARGRWKLEFTTDSLEEAAERFTALEAQGKQVALYELGLFEHEGQQIAGQVAFWWSESFNESMEGEPRGRGVGWTDGYNTYVTYTHPDQPTAEAANLPAVAEPASQRAVEVPAERYVEGACDHCGRILPMNELHRMTREAQVGRNSGTHRVSHSTTSRVSNRSASHSNTRGSSSSSGRAYYKTENLVLCEACYARQVHADRGLVQIVWDFFNKR